VPDYLFDWKGNAYFGMSMNLNSFTALISACIESGGLGYAQRVTVFHLGDFVL
jgi:hypothetical protein